MSLTDLLNWAYANMEYPWVLLLIIPLIPIIYWFLKREVIMVKEDLAVKLQKKRIRKLMFFTRSIMLILLLIALASPFVQEEKTIEGDPFVMLLVDNSTSMELFEDFSADLGAKLEKKMNVEVKSIGSGTVSNIGDSILSNLQPYSSVLLISDGNSNSGADLGDVALFASKLNSTINAVKLNPIKNDAHVVVYGPAKTMENSENSFSVVIGRAGNIQAVHLKVVLDGEVVYDQVTNENIYTFTRRLPKGNHKIVATIDSPDYWPQNNVFYKTVRVVPQPKVLFYSEKVSPMETLLKQLYVVDTATSIPDLKDYYAVVVNDINADKLNSVSDVLNDFVADGNGMVVFGGENSYDKGNYRDSLFETLLPVSVGTPGKEEGDVILAIVIDISGSAGAPFGRFESTADFEKSATLGILQGLKIDTRVAIIAFNTQAYLISEPSRVFEKAGVEDFVARLKFGGGTQIASGLLKAIAVLSEYSGSKNIVLLSDGKTQGKENALESARFAANNGIKIYTVGVGPTTDEQFMMDLADLTNGIYFRATDESKLNILFGPVDDQEERSGTMGLVVLNNNHFITAGYEPQEATIYGFNQVSPKDAGRLLVTTTTGEPILTVWRLGLGRVAAVSTDDGGKWGASLLASQNSKLIARTVNWAIGDPERKSASFVDAKDTRLNEPAEVTVKSEIPPNAPNVAFYKIDEDLYTANVMPSAQGFQEVAGALFAVNYEKEYETSGLNHDLEKAVQSTGGRVFEKDDIEGMVDHAKTRATRIINARNYVRWPFMLLAIIIFLLEIFIRRIIRKE